jgi:hypothetical protein
MADELARSNEFPFEQRIAEAVSMGIPIEEIAQHFSDSKDKSHKLWLQQYKGLQVAERARERTGQTSEPSPTAEQSTLAKAQKWAEENPITTAALATGAAGLAAGGAYAIKERIKSNAEIRKERELAKIIPPGVQQQREELDFRKQQFAAEQEKLIRAETNNAIKTTKQSQLAADFENKFNIPFAQAQQFSGGEITNAKDAEIIGNAIRNKLSAAVNPIPGAVSNQPAGAPNAVNPMNELTQQPPAYPLIKPETPTPAAPAGAVAPAAPMQAAQSPAAPVVPPQTAPQVAPVAPAAPQAAPAAPSQPQTLMTGTGREVIAGQGPVPKRFPTEFKSPLDVPKGYVFVPGAQYIDTLRNDLGQATYTEHYKGREFPSTYEQALEEGKGINRSLNRPTREERKAQGIAPPEVTKGINRQVGQGKLVKVAGVAGSLVAIADIAKAAQQGNYGQAAAQGLDVATDYIPGIAQLKQGMSPTSAGAPVVPPQQISNAALLGSPYAQTDWAKTQRLREKAQAGRGTLPPSAYR